MLASVRKSVCIVAVLVPLSTRAFAQLAAPSVHVTGIVVESQTETAIRRARVEAALASTRYPPVFTDERGRFSLDVPAGVSLTISKAGFAPESVTVRTPRTSDPADIQVSMSRAAVIAGRIVDASGTPLVNMSVVLREAGGAPSVRPRTTQTNDLGEFRFGALTAGEFALQSPIATPSVLVRPGDSADLGDVVNEVPPGVNAPGGGVSYTRRRPAITGTISDEYGEPIQGAFIRALQIRRVDERLAALPVDGVSRGISDDRGMFRVFGLSPGRYLVAADVEGYASTYYAGVTSVASAFPVAVDRADADGIDFAFRRELTVRVSGTALDSTGQPIAGAVLLGVSQRSGGIMTEPRAAQIAPDGAFVFDSVSPGDYVLQASAPVNGLRPKVEDSKFLVPRMEFGMQPLTVTDVEPPPVLLRTSAGATLRGRTTVEGQAPLPRTLVVWPFPTNFDLSPMVGSGAAGLTKNNDGSFVVTGVTGPRRFVMMAPVDGWYLKDARVRGADAMDAPFDFGIAARDVDDIEVVVSPAAATVAGTVTKPGGDPVADGVVLVFSTDASKWYRLSQSMRMARPSLNGEFRVGSLPPGSYYVLALDAASDVVVSGDWQDSATLEKLGARATRIDLNEGERRTLALRTNP